MFYVQTKNRNDSTHQRGQVCKHSGYACVASPFRHHHIRSQEMPFMLSWWPPSRSPPITPGQGCEPNPYNAVGNVLADEGAVLKSVGYAFCELIPSAAAGVPSVLAGNAGDMSSVVWSGGAVLRRDN